MPKPKQAFFREYRTLIPHLRRYRWAYLGGLLFLILTDAGQILIPQFIGQAVDLISDGNSTAGDIGRLMMQVVILAVFVALGRYGWRNFIIGSARRVEYDIRHRMYVKLLTLTDTFFANHRTGDLMARITNDLQAVRMSVGMGTIAFVDGVFMTLVILSTLFIRYGALGLIIVIPLPLLTCLALLLGRMVGPLFLKVQERFARISEYLQESLSGIRVIKSFVMEKRVEETFVGINTEYAKANMNLIRFWGMLFPAMSFLAGLGVLFLLYFGGQAVIQDRTSPGDFIAMLSYLGMLIWPAMGAGWVVNLMQRGAASMRRINQILGEEPDIVDLPNAIDTPPNGDLEFNSVSYDYGTGAAVLTEVSFSVPEGSTLGILGRTGSGKTTLLKLISRIIDPAENSICIGGQDIRTFTRSSLRRALGIVPQDVFLFSETIRSNIVFTRPDATEEEISEAVRVAGLEPDLAYFPDGLNTMVGEKGVTLSGGQKQRIAIARAIIARPHIFILDNALSAVDADTEERILNGLFELCAGRTTVMIAHRVSALSRCARCITLEDGRVTSDGTHEKLMATDGLYRDIAALQRLENSSENPS